MYLLRVAVALICFGYIYSGQGGYITLINETNSDWLLVEQTSYQMNSWNFPSIIRANSIAHVYVEWSQEIFHHSSKDNGTAVYRLVRDGEQTFRILARADLFRIEVIFQNIVMDGQPESAKYDLGWQQDGDVTFVLIEKDGSYTGTNLNSANWMMNNRDILGNRTLKEICIPGSHDSGMSLFGKSTLFSHPCNTLTQTHTIKGQLLLGVRYFDIRPVISDGQVATGHYEKLPGTWQGGNGQSLNSIVDDINEFTKSRSEIIIVNLSHSLNTDLKNSKYRKFNQSEWNGLFDLLDTIDYLYINDDVGVEIPKLTVNELIKNGKQSSVIFIIGDSGVELGSRFGKGYFYQNSTNIYDDYANTHKLQVMTHDQINKMSVHSKERYFLLSWTLTQSVEEILFCSMESVKSIKDLATEAKSHLAYTLYTQVTDSSYPNIISIDDIKNSDVTAIAMAINKKISSLEKTGKREFS